MLRSLVLILLIVNAAFFAWSQGWLNQMVGVQPNAQHEPQRLSQQIHADKIVVLAPKGADDATDKLGEYDADGSSPGANTVASAAASEAAAVASAATSTATTASAAGSMPGKATVASSSSDDSKDSKCVEAGPFSATEFASAEANVRHVLPAGSWSGNTVSIQGLWLVYMGPYSDADMLERKQAELRRIKGLNFEEVRTPANLAMGISLGRYNKQDDADAALVTFRNRGIRTAKVVNVRPTMDVQVLKVPKASVSMQVALAGLKLPQGKGFSACRP
jgi:hypothetical protein